MMASTPEGDQVEQHREQQVHRPGDLLVLEHLLQERLARGDQQPPDQERQYDRHDKQGDVLSVKVHRDSRLEGLRSVRARGQLGARTLSSVCRVNPAALTSKATDLLRLHTDPDLLVVVNVWDVVSATVVAAAARLPGHRDGQPLHRGHPGVPGQRAHTRRSHDRHGGSDRRRGDAPGHRRPGGRLRRPGRDGAPGDRGRRGRGQPGGPDAAADRRGGRGGRARSRPARPRGCRSC